MMSDCNASDAEDAIVRLGDEDVGVRVVIGNDAALNEHVSAGDIGGRTSIHVLLHLRADTAARFRIERSTMDIRGGGTPELEVHFVSAGGAIHVHDVGGFVVISGISVSAARAILAIDCEIAALACEAVGVPEFVRIRIACVMAICGGHSAHGNIVRRFIAFDPGREIMAVLAS